MVCLRLEGQVNKLKFAYWIPEEIFDEDITLSENLEKFANKFGLIMKVALFESKYIKSIHIQSASERDDPSQLVKQLSPKHITSIPHVIGRKVSNTPTVFLFEHSFMINYFQYLFWVQEIETIPMKVRAKNLDKLVYLNSLLNPINRTNFTYVSPPKHGESISEKRNDDELETVIFNYPTIYEPKFKHINSVLEYKNSWEAILLDFQVESKKCVFCGDLGKSKEHILPQWLKRYFPEQVFDGVSTVIAPENYEDLLELQRRLLSGARDGINSSYGITTNKICVKCNGGWLSRLESDVKNMLVRDANQFIKNSSAIMDNEDYAFTLSRWSIIKALLRIKRKSWGELSIKFR